MLILEKRERVRKNIIKYFTNLTFLFLSKILKHFSALKTKELKFFCFLVIETFPKAFQKRFVFFSSMTPWIEILMLALNYSESLRAKYVWINYVNNLRYHDRDVMSYKKELLFWSERPYTFFSTKHLMIHKVTKFNWTFRDVFLGLWKLFFVGGSSSRRWRWQEERRQEQHRVQVPVLRSRHNGVIL